MGVAFKLNNKESCSPVEWGDIEIEARFALNNQASLSIDNFTFVNKDAREIINYINEGVVGGLGIFEGMPFEMDVNENGQSLKAFDGIVDFTEEFEIINESKVQAKVKLIDGLNALDARIDGLTVGYLESIGVYTGSDYSDVDFVIEKKFDAIEFLILGISLFVMIKETQYAIKEFSDRISEVAKGGTPITTVGAVGPTVGPNIGAIIWAAAKAVIWAAYIAILIKAIFELGKQLIDIIMSPVRTHKCIKLGTLLEKAINYLGYSLESPISELDSYYYLPSAPLNGGVIKKGIPQTQDYGYQLSETVELCLRVFNARLAIDGDKLIMRTKDDPFWFETSTYVLPEVLTEKIQYNTDEANNTLLINFQTDIQDDWTVDNYTGTSYEVSLQPKTINRRERVLIKGLETVDIPLALGTRKDGFTALENTLKDLAKFMDALLKVFLARPQLEKRIARRVGMLKISTQSHTVPKLLVLSGKNIDTNHRDKLSAKYLENKFHNEKSFVRNNYGGQKIVQRDIRIPFGFSDFVKVLKNSVFKTVSGKVGRILSLKWRFNSDYAIVDYELNQIYTTNLKETFIEP